MTEPLTEALRKLIDLGLEPVLHYTHPRIKEAESDPCWCCHDLSDTINHAHGYTALEAATDLYNQNSGKRFQERQRRIEQAERRKNPQVRLEQYRKYLELRKQLGWRSRVPTEEDVRLKIFEAGFPVINSSFSENWAQIEACRPSEQIDVIESFGLLAYLALLQRIRDIYPDSAKLHT